MATCTRVTAERCAQLGRALTGAGLTWSGNGRQAKLQYLGHAATGPEGTLVVVEETSCGPNLSSATESRSAAPRPRPASSCICPSTATRAWSSSTPPVGVTLDIEPLKDWVH
ncbi:hypothetical protein [Streptomyces sp. NPDC046805]|uniref:hypothetical protein n=1 Tax=Streptomyces sp. NPDC046805 TaxID=3155134 RepID=UPI0033F56F03